MACWPILKWYSDEQGAAAALTTQLDDYLRGLPTQHRECEGAESKHFRGYFKGSLIVKEGGVKSGFNHVETNHYAIRRLLHVKGKKHVHAREVPMTWNSVNDGDVFILDVGQGLIQWNAPKSNRQEKLKAAELARNIRGNGLARVNIESYFSTIQTCRLLKKKLSYLLRALRR
jgi:hypothetical protein